MTVTAKQIAAARAVGLTNVEHIAAACNATGCKFYFATAMIAKESRGRNVWGGDEGGVFSGFPDEVNEGAYRAFEHEVLVNGRTSNGVGPAQITHPDNIRKLKARGLKGHLPADTIRLGVELLLSYYVAARKAGKSNADAIRAAGTRYNGKASYGEDLLVQARRFHTLLGDDDYR